MAMWTVLPPGIRDRFLDFRGGYESARKLAFENALDGFLRHPIIGGGRDLYRLGLPSSTGVAAHNTYIGVLAEGGLIAGLVYVAFLAVLFAVAVRRYERTKDAAWIPLAGAVATYAVASGGLSFVPGDLASTTFAMVAGLHLGIAMKPLRTGTASTS